MSGANTIRLISAYNQMALPTRFLSGFFRSPPQNFHDTKEVEIDIIRSGEEVAIVIQDMSAGYRNNSYDQYTNKGFTPPVYKEAGPLNVHDLMARTPGRTPFEDPNFQADAIVRSFNLFSKLEQKIRRAIEIQASQVLQTGIVSLTDETGTVLYTLNYQPKTTHFPSAGTAWDADGADPLLDLDSLARVIRGDGLSNPDTAIFGVDAWNHFIRNETVQKLLENRRMELGVVAPVVRGGGATFMGRVMAGNYWLNLWTYDGRFTHPETGVSTYYVTPAKVILMDSQARLDATFGGMPRIVPPDGRVLQFLPNRISNAEGGMDLFTNAWVTPDGETLFVGAGARPLMIPTAIDTFGCLDTGVEELT